MSVRVQKLKQCFPYVDTTMTNCWMIQKREASQVEWPMGTYGPLSPCIECGIHSPMFSLCNTWQWKEAWETWADLRWERPRDLVIVALSTDGIHNNDSDLPTWQRKLSFQLTFHQQALNKEAHKVNQQALNKRLTESNRIAVVLSLSCRQLELYLFRCSQVLISQKCALMVQRNRLTAYKFTHSGHYLVYRYRENF